MDEAKVQISLRVPADLVQAFDKIAAALERDRSWVMQRALKLYLQEEGADLLQEIEGIESADRGEGVDFDIVLDELDAIVAAAKDRRKAG